MDQIIKSNDDVMVMLDQLMREEEAEWWNEFYATRKEKIPFYHELPDESLVEFIGTYISGNATSELELPKAGGCREKALDIGCGIGRNTMYLANQGYNSEGIDISSEAIMVAVEKSQRGEYNNIKFSVESIFDYDGAGYSIINDSGCLHHMKPHRRYQYLEAIHGKLVEGGFFTLSCFSDEIGEMTDYDAYREKSLKGGMGYNEGKLRAVLEPYFEILEMRKMKEQEKTEYFSMSCLWAVVMKKK